MRDDISKKITEIETKFPFPQAELARLQMRRWILQYARARQIGAEIGVLRGHFSEVLMRMLQPRKIYLVDPWTKQGESFSDLGSPLTNKNTLSTRVARDEAALRAQRFPNIEVVIIENFFPACLSRFTEKLNWVYLDASHKYRDTMNELEALEGTLAPGGVILGDDWYANPAHKFHGVFRAVNEFAKKRNYDIVASGPAAQWCIRRTPAYRD